MGFSNGQVQKQSEGGNGEKGERGDPGLPGIGFNLTDDGNFDIDSKRLTDVAEPVDKKDAATRNYVDIINTQQDMLLIAKLKRLMSSCEMEPKV